MGRARRQLVAVIRAAQAARIGGRWVAVAAVPAPLRERVDAAVGAVLETLAPIPDLHPGGGGHVSLNRRQFLRRSGAAALPRARWGASAGSAAADAAPPPPGAARPLQRDGPLQRDPVADPAARLAAVPFHGEHQAGIVSAPPPAACFAALDVVASDRAGLAICCAP